MSPLISSLSQSFVVGTTFPKIVTNGLVLYVDAGLQNSYSGSGTIWRDLSGRGNNMTLFNGVSYSNGVLTFNGNSSQYAEISQNLLGTGTSIPHTVDMWVNFTTIVPSVRWWIMVLGQYSPGSHHWIGTSSTNTLFGKWSFEGDPSYLQLSPNLEGINIWLNLTSTFDGTTYNLYKNYTTKYTTTGFVNPYEFNFTNTYFTIAKRAGAENYFNGKIALARVYNRALTDEEVAQNFNALRGRFGI